MLIRRGDVVQVEHCDYSRGTFVARATQDFTTEERYFGDFAMLKYMSGNARDDDGVPYAPGDDVSTPKGLVNSFLVLKHATIISPGTVTDIHSANLHVTDLHACEAPTGSGTCGKRAVYFCFDCAEHVCKEHYKNGCRCTRDD